MQRLETVVLAAKRVPRVRCYFEDGRTRHKPGWCDECDRNEALDQALACLEDR